MSWSKFKKMVGTDECGRNIGVAGAGKKYGVDTPSGDVDSGPVLRQENGAGASDKKAPEIVKFSKKQEAALHVYLIDPKFWLPAWVRELASNSKAPEGLIKEVIARIEKDPHQNTLLEAQLIFNELGRDPANTGLIRKYFSREFIKRIFGAGRPNK
jgi:hypothetical protein